MIQNIPEVIPDLEPPVDEPVIVSSTATTALVTTLVRYALVMLAGYLLAKGLVSEETRDLLLSPEVINAVVVLLLGLVPTALGMLKVKRNNAVQQTLANHLPDYVARVK